MEFSTAEYVVDENGTNAVITVLRSGGTTGNVGVQYTTRSGSASAGQDYQDQTGILTFPEGEVRETFQIPILQDLLVETPETVHLALTNTTGGVALGPQPTATLTIISDDSVVSFLTATFSVNENVNTGNALISVVRTGATNTSVSVEYLTQDGTAIGGLNYIRTRGSMNFAPGEMLKTFSMPIIDNAEPTGNRTVLMTLTNVTANGVLGVSSAVLTIVDDDFASGILNFSAPTYTVNEYQTNVTITVVRTNGSTGIVSVRYSTSDGTARMGQDFMGVNGTLSFADGETVKTFNIPIIPDYINETNETVILALSVPTGGASIGSLSTAILTIINNNLVNGSFSFTQTNYTSVEGALQARVTVSRSFGALGDVFLTCRTVDGTALGGIDFEAITNVLFWPDGDNTPKDFVINLINDSIVEAKESFAVEMLNPTGGGTLGLRTNTVVTVSDDDFGPGYLSLASATFKVWENATNAVITVVRTYGDTGTVSVAYQTLPGGTALPNVNYTNVSGVLTFAPGETNKSFLIPVIDNAVVEVDKTIYLEISNPTGGASLLNQITSAVVNLVEDDAQAGSLDMAFGEPNDQVYTVVLQTNRNYLFVGGDFSAINGQPRSRLARFEPNGNWDPSFDVGGAFSGSVRTLAIQNDGKFVVGGSFTNAFSGSNSYLVRLNADASQDTNFFGGLSGVNNLVYAVAVQSDGKLIIGGLFSAVNGTNRNFLARVNANGALDMNFNPAAGTDGAVRAIALQYDGKILIAGDFRTVNGVTRNRIARLEADGTLDMSFDPGFGADDSIRAMVLYLDGRAVIGGLFQTFDGTPRIRVARLGFDGKLDPTFDPGAGANEFVSALAVQPDGKILVGGAFTTFNGIPHQRITRLNENGSVDASINFGQGANNYISTIALQPDRKIVIGGAFTEFDGQRRPYLARLYGGENLGPGSMNFSSTNYLVVENQSKVLVSVRRQIGTTNSVSVNFTTADGTAIAGTHYMPTNGTLNFGPGETVKFFEVVVIDDGVINADRAINLILSDATGGAVLGAQSRAQISVVNDDCRISFAISQFSVSENAGLADITVERIGSTVGTVSVDYTMTDNTATAGVDYIRANTTTLTFVNGQSNATFAVAVLDDDMVEPNEMVDLALSRPAGSAVLDVSAAQLTIVDNDFSTGLFSFSQPNFTATERGGQALITVTRSGGNAGSAAVNFNTANVEATAGSDYIATNGLLVFADGEISKTFPITILDDALVENRQGEAFEVALSNPTGAQIGQGTATVTILSDEALFTFSQTNYTYFETNVVAMVTVLRGTNGTGPVSVSFITSNNTAVAGADFVGTNGVLNWAAGDYTPQTILIPLVNDNIGEPVEDFTVMLLNPTGEALLGMDSITTVAILDDDISFSFELANYMVAENATNYRVNVIRTGLSNAAASVNFATSDGTAKASADYVFTSLKLDFTVDEVIKQVVIPIIDDTIGEGNEDLFLNLASASTNASVGPPSTATLTIIDNEDSFSLSSTNYVVDESGTNASITVIRSGNPGLLDVVLFYSTTNITAIPGTNYTNVNGPLIFSPGETMKSFNIPVIDDAIAGGDVTVGIRLFSDAANLRGAVLVPPTNAVLTILDNDVSVGFGAAILSIEEGNTNLVLPVSRTGALSNIVRVAYTTSNGTARAGSDYITTSGMLTFAPGVTNQNIVVSALDDLRIEGNEVFSVRLFNPTPTNITLRFGGVLNVTLMDNDTSIIVPSGSAFLTESLTNNGVIDVGETVTLNFGLRNVGNADTINLIATLLPTNGVTSPNPTQRTYGAVLAGGRLYPSRSPLLRTL